MRWRITLAATLLAAASFFVFSPSPAPFILPLPPQSTNHTKPPPNVSPASIARPSPSSVPILKKKEIASETKNPKTYSQQKDTLQRIADQLTQAKQKINALSPAPAPPAPTRIPQAELAAYAQERMVNFVCEAKPGEVTIATGFLVSSRGHILTNAHVVESAVMDTCLIRNGSPARDYAFAKKIFYPTHFAATSTSEEEAGRDVSIWQITRPTAGILLPASFPFLNIDPGYNPRVGDHLSTFSYPAELLSYQVVLSFLYLILSETIVEKADALIIRSAQGLGSQQGSSGGALINPYTKEFTGMIFGVSSLATKDVADRRLYSLTPLAIDRAVFNQTGRHTREYLADQP